MTVAFIREHAGSFPVRLLCAVLDVSPSGFSAERPNQVWAADLTDIPTAEGWLSLAAIIDRCTRKIVGTGAAAGRCATRCMPRSLGRPWPWRSSVSDRRRG